VVSDGGFPVKVDPNHLFIGSVGLPWWIATFVVWPGGFSFTLTSTTCARLCGGADGQPIMFIHGEDDPVISSDEPWSCTG
jgi:hypothetical protein